jgi:hypothetical protein
MQKEGTDNMTWASLETPVFLHQEPLLSIDALSSTVINARTKVLELTLTRAILADKVEDAAGITFVVECGMLWIVCTI